MCLYSDKNKEMVGLGMGSDITAVIKTFSGNLLSLKWRYLWNHLFPDLNIENCRPTILRHAGTYLQSMKWNTCLHILGFEPWSSFCDFFFINKWKTPVFSAVLYYLEGHGKLVVVVLRNSISQFSYYYSYSFSLLKNINEIGIYTCTLLND